MPAVARHQGVLTQGSGQQLADHHQQAIARRMSEAVVDQLEAVEIEEEYRVVEPLLAPRLDDGFIEPALEQGAVRQARQ